MKITHARKGNTRRGDFHTCSRFARFTIPEEKWGTTHSLWKPWLLTESNFFKGDNKTAEFFFTRLDWVKANKIYIKQIWVNKGPIFIPKNFPWLLKKMH